MNGMFSPWGKMPPKQDSGYLPSWGHSKNQPAAAHMQAGIAGGMGEAMNGLGGMKGMTDMLKNWRGINNG
jgi:hypothetical protein